MKTIAERNWWKNAKNEIYGKVNQREKMKFMGEKSCSEAKNWNLWKSCSKRLLKTKAKKEIYEKIAQKIKMYGSAQSVQKQKH